MSRFDELHARLWALQQELETEAERLRTEFAQRLADGGAQLQARQRALRRPLLPYPLRVRPACANRTGYPNFIDKLKIEKLN